jgi:hypothetical protein
MENTMQEKNKGRAIGLVAGLAIGAVMVSTLSASAGQRAASITNPTQAQALDALETARNYIQAHPDAPIPTTPPATTTAPATTTPPPASGFISGMPWQSGVNPQSQSAANVAGFQTMRGRPVDVIVIHPARDNWSALNANWAYTEPIPANYRGHLVFSMPLWPGNGSVSTNYNTDWTAWANRVEALDPKTDVRLGWEMNLPNPWHVNSSNRTAWVAAFKRAASSIKTACPTCTITWNPNWGNDQTGIDTRAVFQEVKASVDVYGIDYYDAWNPVLTDADNVSRANQTRSLADSYNYALANGKKFALPEWGVGCNGTGCQWAGHAGGDNPRFINHVYNWLKTKPANTIAYEAYFDEPASYIHSELRSPTVNPNSAAAYRTQITALAD